MLIRLVALLGILVASGNAMAWGDDGHAAVGEIGERNLTDAARVMVRSIMGVEPLAVAATFPDHVRDDPRYKAFAPYHFVEIPDGQTYPAGAKDKDANAYLTQGPGLLKNKNVPKEAKIIILRYLIHLVGDVHQPLHVGNDLDRGANLCRVNWEEPSAAKSTTAKPFAPHHYPTNLHTVWDTKLIDRMKFDYGKTHSGFVSYTQVVSDILTTTKLSAEENNSLYSATLVDWYSEAKALYPQVYPDKAPVTDAKLRPYCLYTDAKGNVVERTIASEDIPLLDKAYQDKAIPLVRKQLLKGGLRLAAMLNEIAKTYDLEGEKVPSEASILNFLNLHNP